MRYLSGLILLSLLAWGISLPADAWSQGFFFWRAQGIQLTGLLAVALLSALLLMATRPRWLEQRLGGLDHLYLLHKWSGIGTGVLVLLHWLLDKSPRWLSQLGWLAAGPRPPHQADLWRGLAKEFGELAFYGMVIFLIISLARKLPYQRFRLIHKLGAVLALLALLHSLYLLAPELRWTSFGLLTQALSLLGIGAALWSLTGQIGRGQCYTAELVAIRRHDNRVVEIDLRLPPTFSRHYQAGQFVLLTLHSSEGAPPFTILEHDTRSGLTTLAIKGLGDYTQQLSERLQLGQQAQIEGPFGRFILPPAEAHPHYWIAGGIGITPFIAWLEKLAERGEQRPQTRLIYCVARHEDLLFAERLRQLTQACGIQLQLLERDRDPRLDFGQLFQDSRSRCWFCGPLRMRQALARYLSSQRLHYERFDFR